MPDKLAKTIENSPLPLKIGTVVLIAASVVSFVWFLSEDRNSVVSMCSQNTIEIVRMQESNALLRMDVQKLKNTDSEKSIVLAEIQKDLSYIRTMLEKMEEAREERK